MKEIVTYSFSVLSINQLLKYGTMIDLQKLNLMFDTLFSDPDIEEKFWDWYTNRNKNISQPPVSGELPPDKDDLTLQDWKKLALQLSEVVSELRNEVKIIKQNRRNEIENAWDAGWDCRGDAIVSNNTDYSASDYFIKRF